MKIIFHTAAMTLPRLIYQRKESLCKTKHGERNEHRMEYADHGQNP